ncbi:MAG: hypothetical protein KGI10_02045 [Thaumarchaeota archaeon]|nr:hypothetical protein [Nitrososphaerota archaeon]
MKNRTTSHNMAQPPKISNNLHFLVLSFFAKLLALNPLVLGHKLAKFLDFFMPGYGGNLLHYFLARKFGLKIQGLAFVHDAKRKQDSNWVMGVF